MLDVLESEGFDVVVLPESGRVGSGRVAGSIESLADARACAELFDTHRHRIDGILVTLPNFGDERAIANAIRMSGLAVPVLVHAFGDDKTRMTIADRRDSFCGKMSACNNLRQYGIAYSLTTRHTVDPRSDSFRADLQRFGATCRVVRGLRGARIGALGARPTAFNTVRYSEKLLERSGISTETLDLSEALGRANRLADDPRVAGKIARIRDYTDVSGIPEAALDKMARLGVVIDDWIDECGLDATAIQCWTALEEFYGVVPCTLMSMMSDGLLSSACETDVAGVVGMHALRLASGTPSALLDWNNNYGDDPNKAVVFHCSNLPKSVFESQRMDYQEIIAGTVGKENTFGTIVGRMRSGPFTFCRVSTDDAAGTVRAYVGEGRVTDDVLQTFGGFGVVEIPNLQGLLRMICTDGFEHHVAYSASTVADAVADAFGTYLGWACVRHV
ncbi:MAG: L-fucose/L-arabinose isomerase family protein [Fimbriimonadaceae bacterium]|nr:L-fucose/L-arabinose isomerase family protein [Fimbriimonadaceae bacterium]